MKQSPRFREGTAYVRIRQQPAHIKYPLIMLQVVANIGVYDADFFNVKPEVSNLHSNQIIKYRLYYTRMDRNQNTGYEKYEAIKL